MRKTGFVLWLLSLGSTVRSQEPAPELLVRAAHCLAVKDFLPKSTSTSLTFGYLLDEKSYPREKVLYVVNFPEPTRSNGFAFTVFLAEENKISVFNIQNNASFVMSRGDENGVSFTDPPLGGTWTQQHLTSAISQIEKQPRFRIPVPEVLAEDPLTRCESYTDGHP